LKFEEDNSEFLWKTFSGEGTGAGKTFTVSAWLKRTELGGIDIVMGVGRDVGGDDNDGAIRFNSDQFQFVNFTSNAYNVRTNAVFRDTSAWYHIMVAVDTTQGTDSNRVKLYVNGEQQTSLTGTAYPTQNYQFKWGRAEEHMVGARPDSDAIAGEPQVNQLWSGYMADVYFVDGQQLTPTDFGEYDEDSGIWKPKAYTGSYGTNGFYLDFSDSANLGDDASGNGNNFTETNITSADQATDTPTNNFCTLNPLVQYLPDGAFSFISEGATKARSTQFDVFYTYASTFGVTNGKWYAEFEYEGSNVDNLVGILDIDAVVPYNSRLGQAGAWSVGFYQSNGTLYVTSDSGVTSTASWGASAADGDIISVALDMDNYFVYFAKNGTWQNSGVPTSGATGTGGVAFDSNKTVGMGCSTYGFTADGIIFTNLGGYTVGTISSAATDANGYGTFEYAPPSGYYALCTKNLAEYG
jgi:hypothetical protein